MGWTLAHPPSPSCRHNRWKTFSHATESHIAAWRTAAAHHRHRRCGDLLCWTGSTVAKYEVKDVPISVLYSQYADLSRMVEWSPSLSSVTVDPEAPQNSLWVMRVPRGLQAASKTVGYPSPNITWEAVLDAPGPPSMTWTSRIRADGTQQNAGFVPSGAVSFAPAAQEGAVEMTLTLSYTLPDPVEWWLMAIISSPLVQGIVRNRMRAGMQRFATTVRAEHVASVAAAQHGRADPAVPPS